MDKYVFFYLFAFVFLAMALLTAFEPSTEIKSGLTTAQKAVGEHAPAIGPSPSFQVPPSLRPNSS